jgi:hypothetical protein
VVPLTEPAVVPLVDVPALLPGAAEELPGVDALPLVPLGELALPEAVPIVVPVVLPDEDVSVPVEAVELLGDDELGEVLVSVEAVLGVVVVPGVEVVDALGVVVVVLVVDLLRSQPAATAARARAAARGMRRFMTSPVQCA